ncbi:MAG TPA: substrate-binding domain-containing protein [Aliidongia sp.]|uniref:substrate-binding domain-containing protein n=1 Tax=Aliidongia sp. TaxID=1914230 RepID=UPI002DDD2BA4|nr:substrate-binding domain-containing protein [Aliidongia sp.]HEV2677913.1 substrate-binding domain-containing protein [Aliidongia sp.]
MRSFLVAALVVAAATVAPPARGSEVRLLTTGAFKQVAVALIPQYEAASGNKVLVVSDTAGGIINKIEAGAPFDLVVLTTQAIGDLVTEGKLVSESATDLAKVGVGVAVKSGAPHPDVGSADAFKRMLLKAKSIAYIDPKAGGSSGIYMASLIERMGLTKKLRRRTLLVNGGLVADKVASGEAEIGLQQISELAAFKGVDMVGPLPKEIQNYTVYGAGIGVKAAEPEAAHALLAVLSGPDAAPILRDRGMERPAGM